VNIAAFLPVGSISAPSRRPPADAAVLGGSPARAVPSILARAYRARAMLAQVRRSALMLLLNEDCGLALVLEDVAMLDDELAALGLQPTGLDVAEIALVGHECRQVYREATEEREAARKPRGGGGAAAGSSSHGMSIRWTRARQLEADTEIDLLQRLRARDSRLELLMRLNVRAPRADSCAAR
jgi:hypothetical protein